LAEAFAMERRSPYASLPSVDAQRRRQASGPETIGWGTCRFPRGSHNRVEPHAAGPEQPEIWRRVMQLNVETMFLTAKHAIPAMIATAGRRAIVNIASISALRPRGLTAYAASKGAVMALTRAIAVDHAKDHVRVNCVAPGRLYTPMVCAAGMTEEAHERRRKASALGIGGTGWDVGHAVRFLLSDHARYITGQTLVVDGGVSLLAPARDPRSP
jgi:NAD(P)-dependent dehydrogenase (short-subunit alcohol dehydrogenase family)